MDGDLTLLTDFYQLTMIQGFFLNGLCEKRAVFDLFCRSHPVSGGYAIFAGLESAVAYIENLRFTDEHIDFLKTQKVFQADFLRALAKLRFTGDIHAYPEGSVMFAGEPVVRVTAPLMEAQIIETALLNIINHQSLIATKSARICDAAGGDPVLEFGLRRAQGPDAGLYGSRAAIIGGCAATSNCLAGLRFGASVKGTHAHSFIMAFENEYSAFLSYADIYNENTTLLIDTYDVLKSGLPNAVKTFKKMRQAGVIPKNYGVRIDSGDIAYLSKKVRSVLDAEGFADAKITASGDLDEHIIQALKLQGAKVDVWGVGTNLITSIDCPSFGGVYKLSAMETENGVFAPKLKLSEDPDKITTPGVKKVCRFYGKQNGKIKADLICLDNESFDPESDLTIFDPKATWKKMTLQGGGYTAREMLEPVIRGGETVFEKKPLHDLRAYCRAERETLWSEYKRLNNPHILPVDLSDGLYRLKVDMINVLRK